MLRNLRSRRRPRHGVFLCVVVLGLLLLVIVCTSILVRRATVPHPSHHVNFDSLLSDSVNDDFIAGEDTIDALDVVDEEPEDAIDAEADDDEPLDRNSGVSGYFFNHVEGVIRRAISKSSFMEDDDDGPFMDPDDGGKTVFGSDDVAVEEKVRSKVLQVKGVEDTLLLKGTGRRISPLREGWGDWFDKKSEFLRKEKMLRSSVEGLNPLRHPIIQDPDAVGVTGITKADKIIRNFIFHDVNTRKITHHHQSNF
ncbi:hypothetical protein LR48_Vigan08g192200 [Vigna angularis]|uniref:Uncharacterized protein n=1 Tax=Phaseolus angularis TaxID=3914 RepID=A0A0L9V7Q0_PHAAN|nr:uncharacterized protein At4g19900 [Vigna angularis]KAG2398067.1 uncharacterized protein HKW66_Vig0136970 [Vigna angularis]KOM51095.1 hypothetical protein LR48_Vigan08g192200 [Vigna angularis]